MRRIETDARRTTHDARFFQYQYPGSPNTISPAPTADSRGVFQIVLPTTSAAIRMKTIGVQG